MNSLARSEQSAASATDFGWRLDERLAREDWSAIGRSLQDVGHAVLPEVLTAEESRSLAAMYPDDQKFRSHIVMASHGFGRGEYKYFAYPLPSLIATVRQKLYPYLAVIANQWNASLNYHERFPEVHDDYLAKCHAAGQTRPTPLLLQYVAGDFNALHQDLYGDMFFPLQTAILLAQPGKDFEGGEFVMSDSVAAGSRVEVVPLEQGDAVIFAVRERPVPGTRGMRRAASRHGVSRVRSGLRHTTGIIFHDAR